MKPRARLGLAVALALLSASGVCIAGEAECFAQLTPKSDAPGGRPLLHLMKLEGVAKGGELVLLELDTNPAPRYIRIETHAGETAEMVIARMAAAINEVSPFNPNRARMRLPNDKGEMVPGDQVPIVRAEGKVLKPFGGGPHSHVFAGTETGLGIPPPPTSLSVSYAPDSQEVSLFWENPDEPFDGVRANFSRILPGTATSVAGKWGPPEYRQPDPKTISRARDRGNMGLRRFYVVGCRGGVLSNAAIITLNYRDGSQEELDTQPFTAGTCPNWKAWAHGGELGALVLEQGTRGEWKRFDQEPKSALKAEDRSYFQLIRTRSPSVVGGVCRKFLGLQPGHTYRIWTRMNTFKMDDVRDDWSFSFHAAAHTKSVTLTPGQMAGTAALPDGSTGLLAGQVAAYGPGSTTKGKFVEHSTDKPGPGAKVFDIALPPGAEVITVWFRYRGPTTGGVGFDWIKLKDITAR